MPTKSKKDLQSRKRRLRSILRGDYETQIDLGNYLVVTSDYDPSDLNKKIKDFTREFPDKDGNEISHTYSPLWDWFTILNKKNKEIYYCDFSMPYVALVQEKEQVAKVWALLDVPFKLKRTALKNRLEKVEFIDDENKINQLTDFYLKENDWDRTFNEYEKIIQERKEWSVKTPLVYSIEKNDIGVVIPFSYEEKTLIEIFQEVIQIAFFDGKKGKESDAMKLISEINYTKFLKI